MIRPGRTLAAGIALSTIFVSIAYGEAFARYHVEEDSPGWSCVDDGNRVCGPDNPEHKPAACYDDGGVIVQYWPCQPWQPNR